MDNKILDKIQKLFSLATSPNEHEAKLAAKKAHELLLQHNITMSQVENYESDFSRFDEEVVNIHSALPVEYKFILPLLTKHFFVNIIKTRKFSDRKTLISFVGENTNIEVAKYVHGFLFHAFRRLYKDWRSSLNPAFITKRARQSYYWGLSKGIDKQLEEQKNRADVKNALVVVDKKLDAFVHKNHGKLRKSKACAKTGNEFAEHSGYQAGKALRIARGIEHKGGNQGLALTEGGAK